MQVKEVISFMDWIKRMNNVMDYIDGHITGEQPLNYKIIQKDAFELIGKGMLSDW